MLTLLKKIFIWWNQDTFGTWLKTIFFGKLVGTDELGNTNRRCFYVGAASALGSRMAQFTAKANGPAAAFSHHMAS